MPDTPDVLAEIVAHHHIRACLAALARGEDRRDADIIAGCFWPDASVDFGIFAGSFDAYLAWVVPGAPAVVATLHTLGQSLVQLRGGSAAAVETHVTAHHRIDAGEGERDVILAGRYLDELDCRAGEWRIAHRAMMYDWTQDVGAAADWTRGLMGLPFLRGLPVGRATGDRSEILFG